MLSKHSAIETLERREGMNEIDSVTQLLELTGSGSIHLGSRPAEIERRLRAAQPSTDARLDKLEDALAQMRAILEREVARTNYIREQLGLLKDGDDS